MSKALYAFFFGGALVVTALLIDNSVSPVVSNILLFMGYAFDLLGVYFLFQTLRNKS